MQVITYHLSHAINETLASFDAKRDTRQAVHLGSMPHALLPCNDMAPGTTGRPPPPKAGVLAHGGHIGERIYFSNSASSTDAGAWTTDFIRSHDLLFRRLASPTPFSADASSL
jgi:hypothetical protein